MYIVYVSLYPPLLLKLCICYVCECAYKLHITSCTLCVCITFTAAASLQIAAVQLTAHEAEQKELYRIHVMCMVLLLARL